MTVYDENGNVLEDYDLSAGYLEDSTKSVHHPAIEGVEDVWHWETIAEYPNGGKDVQKIVDVPGVTAKPAWDEEIPIQIYRKYTQDELDKIEEEKNKPTPEERIAQLEEALALLLSGVTE